MNLLNETIQMTIVAIALLTSLGRARCFICTVNINKLPLRKLRAITSKLNIWTVCAIVKTSLSQFQGTFNGFASQGSPDRFNCFFSFHHFVQNLQQKTQRPQLSCKTHYAIVVLILQSNQTFTRASESSNIHNERNRARDKFFQTLMNYSYIIQLTVFRTCAVHKYFADFLIMKY
jgi:hypothetical protein